MVYVNAGFLKYSFTSYYVLLFACLLFWEHLFVFYLYNIDRTALMTNSSVTERNFWIVIFLKCCSAWRELMTWTKWSYLCEQVTMEAQCEPPRRHNIIIDQIKRKHPSVDSEAVERSVSSSFSSRLVFCSYSMGTSSKWFCQDEFTLTAQKSLTLSILH